MSTHEAWEILLMKAVDGVLDTDERTRFDAHLVGCERCRDEFDDFSAIKEGTDLLRARILADARIESPRPSPTQQRLFGLGTLMCVIGALILLGFSVFTFFADVGVPLPLKLGLGLVGLGGLILFLLVARTRLRAIGSDPYSEIDQ